MRVPAHPTLATGNSEGHVCVVDSGSLSVRSVEKGAHMIFVTTMAYNTDGSVVRASIAYRVLYGQTVTNKRTSGRPLLRTGYSMFKQSQGVGWCTLHSV